MKTFFSVCALSIFLIFILPLIYILEHHPNPLQSLIDDACTNTEGGPGYWYWTDGQPIPDGICATEYTLKTITSLKYGVEIIQLDGAVKFSAFDSKEAADSFIKIQPYKKRTLIQDKQRKK